MVMIGLEIHAQLKTGSKIFCDCPTDYLTAEPNSNICPICTAQPGSKPSALNRRAVENVIKIALALNCKLSEKVLIQRKHYFYPDLPAGYQRTSKPVGIEGKLGKIRIREVHIEEDPGRYELRRGTVDYNRAGVPLIEIVTEPDFKSPEEAREFLEELVAILNYLDSARDEPGSSRIDANISLPEGARVEVKNINSFKGVYTALSFEIVRQQNLLRRGMKAVRETRHFDEVQGITIPLRKKESEEDYRYVPDPDVPPLFIDAKEVARIKGTLPELPRAKADRFVSQYGIRPDDAWMLVGEVELANLFERMSKKFQPQKSALWIRGPLKKQLNYREMTLGESDLKEDDLYSVFDDFLKGNLTDDGMEKALIELLDKKAPYNELRQTLGKITDMAEIKKAVDSVLARNEKAIADYRRGRRNPSISLSARL